jgi:coproporphyrinogen III oxidase-like Fe-S oxidoreductase
VLSTLNKEAIKLLNLIRKVHLFKIKEERTLLIDLLYNLTLSNLKKFKKSLKLILVNLL